MSSGTAGVEGAVFEPPFPIPESWVWTKLGEIGDTNIGLTYHPQDISDNGIPVLRSNNIQNGNLVLSSLVRVACHILPSQFIKNGDVLICARNGSKALVGKSVLVDSLVEPTSFGAFMAVFRSQFNPFIQLFLQSDEFKQYLNKSNSTTIHQLTQSMLKDAWMPFPPFSEQQRIVKRFDALSALCDAIDIQSVSLSVLAEQAKQKVLDLAIRGLLVSQNPTDEPASTLLDCIRSTADKPPCPKKGGKAEPIGISDPLFPIPESWEWTTLGEIGEVVRGTGIKRSDMSETGRPCVRYGEIYTTYSLRTEKVVSFISEELFRSSKHVQARSVLMTLTGEDRKDIAKTIAYLGDEPIAISGDMLGICPREVEPLYLSFALNSPWAIERKGKLATGDLVIHISQKSMSCFPVPLPPLAEQRRIVAKVEELFAAVDAMATK